MSADRDTTRIVLSWLRTDERVFADRILDDVLAAVDTTPQRRRSALARRFLSMNTYLKVGLATAAVVAAVVIGLQVIGPPVVAPPAATPPPPTPSEESTPTPATSASQLGEWFGPVRTDLGQAVVAHSLDEQLGAWSWTDPRDAAMGWVDATRVSMSDVATPSWYIELAGWPPPATGEGGGDLIVAHGVVLDTTGDGVADYLVGVDNDVPRSGGQIGDNGTGANFHVWVTNLGTGQTEERSEPPYGYPVDFGHFPGGGSIVVDGVPVPRPPSVGLSFIARPAGLDIETVRYYVWTSTTEAGRVVAWDYAPDAAWLRSPYGP